MAIIAHNEIHFPNIQSLFTDRCGHKYIVLSLLKVCDNLVGGLKRNDRSEIVYV